MQQVSKFGWIEDLLLQKLLSLKFLFETITYRVLQISNGLISGSKAFWKMECYDHHNSKICKSRLSGKK